MVWPRRRTLFLFPQAIYSFPSSREIFVASFFSSDAMGRRARTSIFAARFPPFLLQVWRRLTRDLLPGPSLFSGRVAGEANGKSPGRIARPFSPFDVDILLHEGLLRFLAFYRQSTPFPLPFFVSCSLLSQRITRYLSFFMLRVPSFLFCCRLSLKWFVMVYRVRLDEGLLPQFRFNVLTVIILFCRYCLLPFVVNA